MAPLCPLHAYSHPTRSRAWPSGHRKRPSRRPSRRRARGAGGCSTPSASATSSELRRATLRCEPQASGRCAAGWCRALRRRAEARRGSGRAAGVLRSRSCRGGRRWAAQGTAVCRTSSDRLRLRQRRGWGGNCCRFVWTFGGCTHRMRQPPVRRLPPTSVLPRTSESLRVGCSRACRRLRTLSRSNRPGLGPARRARPADARHRPPRAATRRSPRPQPGPAWRPELRKTASCLTSAPRLCRLAD